MMASKFCLPYNRKLFEMLPTKFSQEGLRCVELTTKTTLIIIIIIIIIIIQWVIWAGLTAQVFR
jgi:hypothetical protein